MFHTKHLFLWVSLLLFTLLDSSLGDRIHSINKRAVDDLKIVCYYSNWAVYRPGLAKFTPQNINPYLCTHLIYAFGGLSSKFELKAFDPYNDLNQGNYKKFVGLKAYNKNLKTLIAIGGWNEGSKRFSKLVASHELRNTFINSALRFLREHNFDGLDLDWEYPGFREGSSPDDRQNYAQFIKELKTAFDNEKPPPGKDRLLLTVAVPAGQEYIDQGFDVPLISRYADFLNVLSYDYHTAFDPETDHHAPLKARPDQSRYDESSKFNTEWTINYYLQLGAPRDKLILGIPTYGRSFTLADPNQNGLTAVAEGPGEAGPSTREKGYLAFYEICQKIEEEGWSTQRPYPQIEGPYSFKDNQWVAYDDIQSIEQKVRFIIDMGLGGAMVWTLDNDDFRGQCYGEQSPLINAVKSAFANNLVEVSSSERTSSRFIRPGPQSASYPPNEELALTALNVNTRRNQLRRINFMTTTTSTTTTTTTTTTTPAPTFRETVVKTTTPEPPPTPDPGPVFECEDEGFFNNPKECRKYFWCLDSGPANLGIVAHAFTCPSGLYFNSKTEACDYPENVSCKKSREEVTTKKPKLRTKPPTTTTTTTTTTPPPTTTAAPTEPPFDLKDKANLELLATALKQLNNAQQNGNSNDVMQLVSLIQSLGGVEKIQNLLRSEGVDDNGVVPITPSTGFFNPSYVTPKRNQETQPPESVTDNPLYGGRRDSQNTIRHRRPQFEFGPPTTTVNPIFSHYETPRNDLRNNQNVNREPNAQTFAFTYNTPEGRNTGETSFNEASLPQSSPQRFNSTFSRISSSTTERGVFTESPIDRPRSQSNQVLRVPFSVSAGRVSRLPDGDSPRRNPQSARRVRVQSAFSAATERPQSSVVYDEEPEPLPQSRPQSLATDSRPSDPTTARPVRRRLPNRFNLRPNIDENPVSALINLPPRSTNSLHDSRPQSIGDSIPTTTSMPTTLTSNQNRPQPVRFTNYNTLPPEFDIAPFTTPANYFDSEHSFQSTTPVPTTTRSAPTQPPRRNTRTRRPIPQPLPHSNPTTTQRPNRRPAPTAETEAPNPDGPAIFSGNDGKIGCSKRGVYAHPSSCGMFVVCGPTSRSNKSLRAIEHHCPTDQVFVQDVGRCRPGNKDRCEVF